MEALKEFTLKATTIDKNGNVTISSNNSGFSIIEIIGVLHFALNDLKDRAKPVVQAKVKQKNKKNG